MPTASTETGSSSNFWLRHSVATLAYRAGKALANAPEGFENTRAGEGSRSAGEIAAHMGDLFDWGLSMLRGKAVWHDSAPLPWEQEVARFFASLGAFDAALEQTAVQSAQAEKIFQGPIADALTHTARSRCCAA